MADLDILAGRICIALFLLRPQLLHRRRLWHPLFCSDRHLCEWLAIAGFDAAAR